MEPQDARPAPPAATPNPAAPPAQPPVPQPPAAGNDTVAGALRELESVQQRPLAEHPDSFARVHAGLQQALSDIDDA